MARNTQVAADHNAPPVTQILAEFVAHHPGHAAGGWSAAVDKEAHRTFLNWFGCAIGAARHESVNAALAAVALLQPAQQSSVLGRNELVTDEHGHAVANDTGEREHLPAQLVVRGEAVIFTQAFEKMNAAQAEAERATLQHILKVRSLLTDKQARRYAAIIHNQVCNMPMGIP